MAKKANGTREASKKRLERLKSATKRDAYPTADGDEIRFVRDKAAVQRQTPKGVGTPRKASTLKPTEKRKTKPKPKARSVMGASAGAFGAGGASSIDSFMHPDRPRSYQLEKKTKKKRTTKVTRKAGRKR